MLVFWEQKLVLLSVPKTGTTALEGAFSPHAEIILRNPPPLKHAPIYRYRRFLKPLLVQGGGADESALKTVAVVRDLSVTPTVRVASALMISFWNILRANLLRSPRLAVKRNS